ncbi:trehalose-phosphatase [Conexibacter sp. DBS9H8]|uniref:trehalose-phosphatase n=1 Tax=Conexibacter sp. DBS9H8 TaxID=2937801 RepID=UPI00200CB392|nr:trehalose-phosphatase [Conexibacter sp. DBS9H8]
MAIDGSTRGLSAPDEVTAALAVFRENPASVAVLLDIDGTLAPIVDLASEATVPEITRQLLMRASRRYRAVACVSGRRASESRAMVGVGIITYIGSHGAELLEPGWTEAVLDPALEGWADRIARFRRDSDTAELRRARVRIEDKGPIVAFHWRGADDEMTAREAVDALAAHAAADGLEIHWGRKVMEVRPPVRIDKGAGVRALVARSGVTRALYAGDDVTDLDAFTALRALRRDGVLQHCLCVGVASEDGPAAIREEADVVVDGTSGMLDVLAALTAGE